MKTDKFKNTVEEILSLADIKINGDRPWDIQVRNDKFYQRVLTEGSLGLGESYVDGWWNCEKLDEFINRILGANLDKKVKEKWWLLVLKAKLLNLQSKTRSFEVAEKHFDLGNDLFEAMLDKRMNYTCGYWKNAKDLDEAQEAKLELICKKIYLKPNMTLLDLGCGYGNFAKYAAEKYGVKVLGVNISRKQVELGNQLCKGLPVELRLQDYREVEGKFDRVISIGNLEHIGFKNYRIYMKTVDRCLKDDGIAFIHTIGWNESEISTDPWTNKYLYPNAMLPSIKQIGSAIEGLFVMEDWHNFGPDYDKTLMAWYENFVRNWHKIKSNYGERFYRMWEFYLLSCAGTFRARKNQLWQIVLSKKGIPGGYKSVR